MALPRRVKSHLGLIRSPPLSTWIVTVDQRIFPDGMSRARRPPSLHSLQPLAVHLRRATGLSMFGVVGLPGLAPLQAPQSARREDEGEDPGHAERVKRPDEQEGRAGLGDLAAKNASR